MQNIFSDGRYVSGEHKIVLRNSTIIFEKRKMNSIHIDPWVRVQEVKEILFDKCIFEMNSPWLAFGFRSVEILKTFQWKPILNCRDYAEIGFLVWIVFMNCKIERIVLIHPFELDKWKAKFSPGYAKHNDRGILAKLKLQTDEVRYNDWYKRCKCLL